MTSPVQLLTIVVIFLVRVRQALSEKKVDSFSSDGRGGAMLTHVHLLLTYQCSFECDHCFLYSGPFAQGTMTLRQVQQIIEESVKVGSVEWIYFEGGEPFLFYPLLVEGVRIAKKSGFQVGIVTNAYWAITEEDASIWLQPFQEIGLDHLTVSDDFFHHGEEKSSSARRASRAAQKLGVDTSSICIKKPFVEEVPGLGQSRGTSVIGGGAMFRGRAVETLAPGLPQRPWYELTQCPFEKLKSPSRVHIDPYGYIHVCQGVSLGNMFEKPFSELITLYNAELHPICEPLLRGGPAALAQQYHVTHEKSYTDECHFCYLARRELLDRFAEYLAPRQVYGLQAES